MIGRVWSLLAIAHEERQYAGNNGYRDEDAKSYAYDTQVPNSQSLAVGDLVLVRDRHHVLGAAIVSRIEEQQGLKEMQRCPACQITGLKRRKTMIPEWRCNAGHEFSEPLATTNKVTFYRADFADTWQPARQPVDVAALREINVGHSDQFSIQALVPRHVEQVLRSCGIAPETLLPAFIEGIDSLPDEDHENDQEEQDQEFTPSPMDRRESVLRAISARHGQPKFRKALIRRYGPACMLSGCSLIQIVEAAHIWPYRGREDNHPDNGLLLRADLHTLFDLGLMAFEPSSLAARFHESALSAGYAYLAGKPLALPLSGNKRPAPGALEKRWQQFLIKQ